MAENTAAAPFPISIESFSRLAPRQKVIGMAGVALLLALLIGGWMWTKDPPYALLFSIQDEKDGGQIVAALSQQNIPYRFSDGGRSILVPQAVVHDTRLRLASQGLPKGGLVGFEIMETQKLGVSQFAEQINYQRALEGELARSIQSLAAVRGARVHLAIPKQTAFLRDDQKTSASVLVSLHPGRTLEPIQVAGIINLVSSSVPQLSPMNVSVIDQEGKLISQQRDPLRDAGLDPTQLKFLREVEADYGKRIEAILIPVVGPNNVRAQVTADLDFSQTDQVAESYKPNPASETAIRSQQTAEAGSGSPQAAGIPGALSNQPPVPATAPLTQPGQIAAANAGTAGSSQNFTKNATINYEVDKTIRHTKGVPGTVRRLSVAVVVNHRKDPTKPKPIPLTAAELKQITDLTREAMGFNKDRGDTLNVANALFTPAEKEVVADAPLWANQELIAILKEMARYLIIAGAAFWLWTRLLKPVFEKLMEPPPPRLAPEKTEFEVGADGMLHRHRGYDEKLADARQLAKKDPKAVANMIKEWVDGSEHGK
ncbi:MAG: flagellar M-ring protein FliF [Rhodocyclales bacterium RIFCSPLOWO2_02_FULL_63_24]|nr:MAG: flagellar M-ring protein FliF [Rhodocyclales bacterium RIFCSPLOWO2_02_FULL_63_24]